MSAKISSEKLAVNDLNGRYWNSLIHSFVYLNDRPKTSSLHNASKWFLFQFEVTFRVKPSKSCLCLLPRIPFTSILPSISPSITSCRRQFLRKMWPIQLAFRLLISCRIFLCFLTLSNISSFLTRSVQLIFSILLQHHIPKLSRL